MASRMGALQVRAAGDAVVGEVVLGPGEFGAVESPGRCRVLPRREEEEEDAEPEGRDGESAAGPVAAGPCAAVDVSPVPLPVPVPPAEPSSGTRVTEPVGRAGAGVVPPAAPTAV
ncbi:hypothetical protein ABZX77_18205 [Streptomyces sp. NPDC004237]|uniref:hypothetical protein n=1 Tax=Streptomyces sp. NPDC004237 TaxID=3154455 RepID=UPI0033B19AAA